MEREERIKSIVSDLIHYAPKVVGFQFIDRDLVDIYSSAELIDIDKNLYKNTITQEVVEVEDDFCGTFVDRLDFSEKYESSIRFTFSGFLDYSRKPYFLGASTTDINHIKIIDVPESHPSFDINSRSYHSSDSYAVKSGNWKNDLSRLFIEQVCERLIGGHGIYRAFCLKDNEFKVIEETMTSIVKEDDKGLESVDIGFCRIYDRDDGRFTKVISC